MIYITKLDRIYDKYFIKLDRIYDKHLIKYVFDIFELSCFVLPIYLWYKMSPNAFFFTLLSFYPFLISNEQQG